MKLANNTKTNLQDRNDQLEKMINSIPDEVKYAPIHKASIILLIYNMVEGIITSLLVELFDYLANNKKGIHEYCVELQLLFIKYYLSKDKKIIYDILKNNSNIDIPDYKSLKGVIKLYSGNLCRKTINVMLKDNFGVIVKNSKTVDKLEHIKELRNYLAHGEKSFKEVGRDLSNEDIKEYAKDAYDYLNDVISDVEDKYFY